MPLCSPFISGGFSEFVDVTIPAAFNLFLFPEDVGVVARLLNMLRHRLDIGHFEQLLESLAFDQLTETFAVLAFFHPPIPDAFDDFFDFVVRLFDLDKGNQQGAHLGTVEDRGLGADQHGADRGRHRCAGRGA
jgi:hypothetical protein